MLSSLLISSSDICTAASGKTRSPPHHHHQTFSQPSRAGLQWWWKQKCITVHCQSSESQSDTPKDQSEDTERLHDPSTCSVTSTVEYETFVFLHWQLKLSLSVIQTQKLSNVCSNQRKEIRHWKRKSKIRQSNLVMKRSHFLFCWMYFSTIELFEAEWSWHMQKCCKVSEDVL